ncbi:MAG: signal peptidase I [Flavobacteriaceae bacterium]|nr:signal peptidase I [Flavobacteriaceae bacterium]
MNYIQIFGITLLISFVIGALLFSKLFIKAGRKQWEAFVPIYNYYIVIKIIERPWWWIILIFIPVVGNIVIIAIIYEFLHVFNYRKKRFTLFTILTLGIFIAYLNFKSETKYVGRDNDKILKNVSSWTNAILFAIVAATLVHTYFMRPYTIPTSSLEKSLLVGDFLFVSKFHYGARVPMTPIALPMVHDSIPFTGRGSYLKNKLLKLPYARIPGFQKIKRNDIVVFNWPADTLKWMWNDNSGKFTYKPIDKKTNYVKRCLAIAGDTFEIRDGEIFIDGKLSKMPDRCKPQYFYKVKSKSGNYKSIIDTYKIKEYRQNQQREVFINLDKETAIRVKNNPDVVSLTQEFREKGKYSKDIFPHDSKYPWSIDNFGPLYIPKKGVTIKLNEETMPLYRNLLMHYEGISFAENGNEFFINGKQVTDYTFKQDYYWMMGDNRQNSLDARYWGFTPFDHVVGKPVLIWMSFDGIKNPRWERFFTTVGFSGKPKSYLLYFFGALLLYFGYTNFVGKKKKNE